MKQKQKHNPSLTGDGPWCSCDPGGDEGDLFPHHHLNPNSFYPVLVILTTVEAKKWRGFYQQQAPYIVMKMTADDFPLVDQAIHFSTDEEAERYAQVLIRVWNL